MTTDDTQPSTYKQIEASLRARIDAGHWTAGAMLPSRRDLAREYGVSPITIERAISPLVREGVLRADDRRGTFVSAAEAMLTALPEPARAVVTPASPMASAAAPPRTCTVGIIASLYLHRHDHLELNNRWVGSMVEAVEKGLSQEGHHTRFINRVRDSARPPAPLVASIAEAMAARVDGLVIIGFGFPTDEVDESLAALDGSGIPVVCITSGPLRRPIPHVFFDNRSGGYEAAHRLLSIGCRDITFFSPFSASWVEARRQGAVAALELASSDGRRLTSLPENPGPWQQEEDPKALGHSAASACLDRGWKPDGVIGASDGVAFGLMAAASERGLEAGRDYALVAFDDHPDARAMNLSSIRQPTDALGQEAARLLARSLDGSRSELQVRLRGHLIPRASSARQLHVP